MSKKFNFGSKFGKKGYYIALALCAAAIGISGYLYYQSANQDKDIQLNDPTGVVTPNGDVQAGVTLPGNDDATQGTEDTKPAEKGPGSIGRPLAGDTVAEYAMDCLSYNETTRDWRVHNGIDIAAEAGTPVCAAAAGTVYTIYKDDTMGYTVVIRHQGDYVTTYSSLSQDVSVSVGDEVAMGDTIGTVANSALLETALGDHLHFSVSHKDEPMDPAEFFEMN